MFYRKLRSGRIVLTEKGHEALTLLAIVVGVTFIIVFTSMVCRYARVQRCMQLTPSQFVEAQCGQYFED